MRLLLDTSYNIRFADKYDLIMKGQNRFSDHPVSEKMSVHMWKSNRKDINFILGKSVLSLIFWEDLSVWIKEKKQTLLTTKWRFKHFWSCSYSQISPFRLRLLRMSLRRMEESQTSLIFLFRIFSLKMPMAMEANAAWPRQPLPSGPAVEST